MLKKSQIRQIVDDVLLDLVDGDLDDDQVAEVAEEVARRLTDISDDVTDDDDDEVILAQEEPEED